MSRKPKEPKVDGCEKDEDVHSSDGKTERSYYYDDAHGYEDFDPAEDEDDETGDDEDD